jgi:rieske (2Fe-2S) protein
VAKAKEFFSITPVRPGLTIFRGIGAVIKTQGMLGSYPVFAGYRFQHKVGTHEDLRIYETAVQTDGSVNEPDDASVLRFRQYYNRWKKDGWS